MIGQDANGVKILEYDPTSKTFAQEDRDKLLKGKEAESFGASIAVSGDSTTILVGAFSHLFNGNPGGITYIYEQQCSDRSTNNSLRGASSVISTTQA